MVEFEKGVSRELGMLHMPRFPKSKCGNFLNLLEISIIMFVLDFYLTQNTSKFLLTATYYSVN